MAKEAIFKIYNGTSWEEVTFPPSSHTHESTLNGKSSTSLSFYAPTSSGIAGQVLKSDGTNKTPVWTSLTAELIKYINMDADEVTLSAALDDIYTKLANTSGGSGGSVTSDDVEYTTTGDTITDALDALSNGKADSIHSHTAEDIYFTRHGINEETVGDVIQDIEHSITELIADLEAGAYNQGGSSEGSSVYTQITTLYLAVDEVVDISSYLASYNEVLFDIDVSNDGTTTFGITNATASWFNCGITTDKSFRSQIHIYKSTNKYMSPINMFSDINLTSCGSLDTYSNKYYIGNSTDEQGTSVEMIISIYGR